MRRPAAAALAVLGAALIVAAALGGGLESLRRLAGLEPARSNLLLVSIDTLRADRLGSYGHAPAATPRLDALAERGLRFTQATTVAPLTLPAHASLFTGVFPAFHGVRDNGGFYLGDEQRTLAEALRQHGYRTGGFVGAFVLDRRWGVAQGFDTYFDDFDLSKAAGPGMDAVQRRGDEVVARAVRWLEQDSGAPFFAWVHLYDPHTPYEAPEPFRSRFPATLHGAYDAEVAFADSLVGRLLDHLARRERLEDTLVVVLSDHGESLGEHREQTHGFFVYEATVAVPLILAGPGVAPGVVDDQVRIVDVMPTVLELLGLPASDAVQGRSLVPLARGQKLSLVAWAESWYPRYHYGWSQLEALRDGRFKFIAAPRPELYDLRHDPRETRDLAAQSPERVAAFMQALDEMRGRLAGSVAASAPRAMDSETQERLQALGYLGGISARHLEERPRGDPKDKIELFNWLKQAGQASIEGRLPDAIALVRRALERDPEIVEGYTLLGNFHAKDGRHADAAAEYRRALALDPEHQGALFSLALAYKNLDRPDDALAGFERAHALDPRNGKVAWQLADVHMQQGRLAEAATLLEASLARGIDEARFALKLGECYLEMRRHDEAEAALRRALARQPEMKTARYNLALVHEARGQATQAMAEYEAELALSPKAYRAAFNLGRLLLKAGRPRDAATRLRQAAEAEPALAPAHLYLAKALLDAGDLDGAQQAARQGIDLEPRSKTAALGHYVLADVFNRLGREREARREVAAARRLERGG